MAYVQQYKARRRVRVIAHLLFGINFVKSCVAALFVIFSLWVASNNGGGTGDSSNAEAFCEEAYSRIFSRIPEMGTLTAEEINCLSTETFAISFLGLGLTIPQLLSAMLLLKATEKNIKGGDVFEVTDFHAQIQLRCTVFQLFLVGAAYWFNGFGNIFYFVTADGAFNSSLLLILSMFLFEFYLEESRNTIGVFLAQKNSAGKKEKAAEWKKNILTQEYIKQNNELDVPTWV